MFPEGEDFFGDEREIEPAPNDSVYDQPLRLISSHSNRLSSMLRSCASFIRPSNLSARGTGTVAGLWVRKAPGFRKGRGTLISNREPRRVVVCGITVMRLRSAEPQGPLNTRAGLTFSTIPRSTSQTSPRFGTFFLFVQSLESNPSAFFDVAIC